MRRVYMLHLFFFFNDTATTEIYTLSLHDALPIYLRSLLPMVGQDYPCATAGEHTITDTIPKEDDDGWLPTSRSNRCRDAERSEEHTSELQSRQYLVCRLLLEKKKNLKTIKQYLNS